MKIPLEKGSSAVKGNAASDRAFKAASAPFLLSSLLVLLPYLPLSFTCSPVTPYKASCCLISTYSPLCSFYFSLSLTHSPLPPFPGPRLHTFNSLFPFSAYHMLPSLLSSLPHLLSPFPQILRKIPFLSPRLHNFSPSPVHFRPAPFFLSVHYFSTLPVL